MTSALTPAALAEIRERDAACTRCGMPGDGAYPIIPVTGEHADWHICALALYHASIAKDATISRLTAELAAARKPQGLKLPRETDPRLRGRGWTLSADLVKRTRDAYRATMDAALPDIPLGAVETVLLAAESLGAQDGGEDKS